MLAAFTHRSKRGTCSLTGVALTSRIAGAPSGWPRGACKAATLRWCTFVDACVLQALLVTASTHSMRPNFVDKSPARLQVGQPQSQGPPHAAGRVQSHGSCLPQGSGNKKRRLKALCSSGGNNCPDLPNRAPVQQNQKPHRLQEAGLLHAARCSSYVSKGLARTFAQCAGTPHSGSSGGALTARAKSATAGSADRNMAVGTECTCPENHLATDTMTSHAFGMAVYKNVKVQGHNIMYFCF